MMPLAAFAMEVYGDDPCQVFEVHGNPSNYNALEKELGCKIHISPLTQYNGALGAALFAYQAASRQK